MAKTPEELEKMFTEMSEKQAKSEKEFQQQIDVARRDAKQYKEMADKTADELRVFKQDAEKREKELKEISLKSRESEISEFVESQVKAGRILPALKDKMVTFMKSLTSETEIMKFSEKDGSVRSHTQISLFKELILKQKTVMPLDQEYSVQEEEVIETPDSETGDAPAGQRHFMEVTMGGEKMRVEVDGVDLAAKAYEYQESMRKSGKLIDYGEALIAVSPKRKSLIPQKKS